jgi:hypothetical protein
MTLMCATFAREQREQPLDVGNVALRARTVGDVVPEHQPGRPLKGHDGALPQIMRERAHLHGDLVERDSVAVRIDDEVVVAAVRELRVDRRTRRRAWRLR